jgi:hypothetical protein
VDDSWLCAMEVRRGDAQTSRGGRPEVVEDHIGLGRAGIYDPQPIEDSRNTVSAVRRGLGLTARANTLGDGWSLSTAPTLDRR